MAVDRLKVRCYRCNQLLAVLPNRAGTVVSCPKCKTELLIPTAETLAKGEAASTGSGAGAAAPNASPSSPAPALSPSSSSPPPTFLGDPAVMIPPDVAALRPEDLRVEAEFFENLTREPPAARSTEGVPSSFFEGLVREPAPSVESPLAPPVFSPPPATPPPPASEVARPSAAAATWGSDQIHGRIETPPPLPEASAVVPPIEIEPATILPPSTDVRRVHEVVLPAAVVLAWSVFVLVGIALSFIAGLLIGHFIWRNAP